MTEEFARAGSLLGQLRGLIVDRLRMPAFAPDLLILPKHQREEYVGTFDEEVAKKAHHDEAATTSEAREGHAIPDPEPSSGLTPPIVMTPSTVEAKDIQLIIPEWAMDVIAIVSFEDEEGEEEDVDHIGGSDAFTDDAFRDHDEDGGHYLTSSTWYLTSGLPYQGSSF
ncbi:uncharacterized protein A4U43_C06F16620 [Asparagus officinalis]|uniref:Uncharacterized protein n=1 Tax=Asparagus officinalis TaxID=4686 RepID=A0A5P1EMC5_ASPOF|nr:uncharacterized protein A4U43_C06F16620 [Asparagus officinalis]